MNEWFIVGIIYINVWILISISRVGKKVKNTTFRKSGPVSVGVFLTIAFVLGYLAG